MENVIIYGILKDKGVGIVKIIVNDNGEKVKIFIIDSGIGISEEVIRNIYNDVVFKNKIGFYNVYLRIKFIYGEGFIIKRLEKGIKIEFYIKKK